MLYSVGFSVQVCRQQENIQLGAVDINSVL